MNGPIQDGLLRFQKKKGLISKKQEEQINKDKLFQDAKKSKIYKQTSRN